MRNYLLSGLKWMHACMILGTLFLLCDMGIEGSMSFAWYRWPALIVFVTVSYFGIRYLKKLWQYLLLAALCAGGAFQISQNPFEVFLLLVLAVTAFSCRFYARIKDKRSWMDKPDYVLVVFYVGIYIISLAMGESGMRSTVYYLAGVYLIIYILHENLSNVQNFLKTNQGIVNMPSALISRQYTVFAVIAAATALLTIFLLPGELFSKAAAFIEKILIAVIGFIFRIVIYLLELGPKGTETEAVGEEQLVGLLNLDLTELPAWVQTLLIIWDFILSLAVVLALLFVIVRVLYYIYRRFYQTDMKNADKIEFVKPDKKERKVKRKPFQIWKDPLQFDFSPSGKVRKRYRALIKIKGEKTPAGWQTPAELEKDAGLEENEFHKELHEFYEKARYSKEGCSRDEAARISR